MKKLSLDTSIQLLGVLAVVASLIFVGLELRQSQRIALADQEQQRAIAQQQNQWAFLEAGYDLDKIARAQDLEALSDGEIVARRTNHHIQWYIAESDFAQYQNGLMSDEVFEAKKRNLTRLLSYCDLRDITDFRLTYFSQDFLELLASIEDPCN